MNCHFRRYCFHLASKLRMTVRQLMSNLDSGEISEWMANDMTQSDEWLESYNKDLELQKSKEMDDNQKLEAFKRMLGGQ